MEQVLMWAPEEVPTPEAGTVTRFVSSVDGRHYQKDSNDVVTPIGQQAVPGLIKNNGNSNPSIAENGDMRIIVNDAGVLVAQLYVADAWDEENETEIKTP